MSDSFFARARVSDLIAEGVLLVEDGNHGEYRPRREEFVEGGTPYIRASDLRDGRIDFARAEAINATAVKRIRKGVGAPFDVILSHKGTVGKVASAGQGSPAFVCSPQTTVWRSLVHQRIHSRYLYYLLQAPFFQDQLLALKSESDMAPYVSLTEQRKLWLSIPPWRLQSVVATLLGALDDKIAANDSIANVSRSLAQVLFRRARMTERPMEVVISDVASFLSRGVTPRYTEDAQEPLILNQKCIRAGRVSLGPARSTAKEKVPTTKYLQPGDILVNSTGVGTLGRVAIWAGTERATVDSHVTIVRFDKDKVDPLCAGFAMLDAQTSIEAMGEGSTGQTELNRSKLGSMTVVLPSALQSERVGLALDALEQAGLAALAESSRLVKLRDVLLPRLMSGEIRVREAEKVVEEAL